MTIPIASACIVLAIAIGLGILFFPRTTVHLEHVRTTAVPTHTVFKSDSTIVGAQNEQDDLFIATTVRLDNKLPVPVSVETITCTLTDKTDAVLTVNAAQKDELPLTEQSFPQLTPLLTHPLLREITIPTGQAIEGTVLVHLPITQAQWDARKSAVLTIGIFHQPDLTLTIPVK